MGICKSMGHSDNLIEWYNTSMNKIVKLLKLQTEKDYFTTEPLSREPVSTVKVLFNPGLFEAKCLQMSKIVFLNFMNHHEPLHVNNIQ